MLKTFSDIMNNEFEKQIKKVTRKKALEEANLQLRKEPNSCLPEIKDEQLIYQSYSMMSGSEFDNIHLLITFKVKPIGVEDISDIGHYLSSEDVFFEYFFNARKALKKIITGQPEEKLC